MAVIGEASVRIVGDLKPLMASFEKAKSALLAFDKQAGKAMKFNADFSSFDKGVKKANDSISTIKSSWSKAANEINKTKISGLDGASLNSYQNKIDAITKRYGVLGKEISNVQRQSSTLKLPMLAGVGDAGLSGFNNRLKESTANVNQFGSTVTRVLGAVGAYLSIKEVTQYADTWTQLGNSIAAASKISGLQSRSLEELNILANQSRSGIRETVELYARMMRSTAGVAKSEKDVAQATDTVNKAFKAGGAAATEQAAGIMQLGQALGSGFLQGDELRSLRENAPLLAQAIADEFKTNIAGLKDLGAEGKLTSERVYKAILSAQKNIDAIYATTSATIADGLTRVKNAMTEYVGGADQTLGATTVINNALVKLADNFGQVADVVMNFVAIIAGALIGRGVSNLVTSFATMSVNVLKFASSLRTAAMVAGSSSIAFGSLAAAAGPLTAILGSIASIALYSYMTSSAEAEKQTADLRQEMIELGIVSEESAKKIDETASSIDKLTTAEQTRKLAKIKDEIDKIRNGIAWTGNEKNLAAVIDEASTASKNWFSAAVDKNAYAEIERIAQGLKDASLTAVEAKTQLEALKQTDVSQPVVDLIEKTLELSNILGGLEQYQTRFVDVEGIKQANTELDAFLVYLDRMAQMSGVSDNFNAEIDTLILRARGGQLSVEDLHKEIIRLQQANPNVSAFLSTLDTMLGKLIQVQQQALNTASAVRMSNMVAISDRKDKDILDLDGKKKIEEAKDYVAEQVKIFGLNKKQTAEMKALEAIRKQALKDNIQLTAEQEKQLVAAQLAGQEARKSEGRKPKKEKKEQLNEYQKEVRSMQERILLMQAEQEVLETLNPVVNDYGFSLAKAEAAQKLLSDAKRAGLEISKENLTLQQLLAGEFGNLSGKAREQAENIYFLSDSYAAATANGQLLKEKTAELQKEWDTFREAGRSSMSGFISDLVKGKSATEALSNAVGKLADALLDIGLNILFGGKGSGGFGVLGQLFGFADGGYTGDGGKYEAKGVVHGGEYVMSKKATQVLGKENLERLHLQAKRGYANGGFVGNSISVPNSSLSRGSGNFGSNSGSQKVEVFVRSFFDADGNFDTAVARVAQPISENTTKQGITEYNSMMPDRVAQIQASPRKR